MSGSEPIHAPDPLIYGSVFISYCHSQKDIAIEIERFLYKKWKMSIIRDEKATRLGDNIFEYMELIKEVHNVVVLLDEGYLRSFPCMFEASLLSSRTDASKVVLGFMDSELKIKEKREELENFWKEELKSLKNLKKEKKKNQNTEQLSIKIARYEYIILYIDKFWHLLQDVKYESLDMKPQEIAKAVFRSIKEHQQRLFPVSYIHSGGPVGAPDYYTNLELACIKHHFGSPVNEFFLLTMADIKKHRKEYNIAELYANECVVRYPNFIIGYRFLIDILIEQKKIYEALGWYEKASIKFRYDRNLINDKQQFENDIGIISH